MTDTRRSRHVRMKETRLISPLIVGSSQVGGVRWPGDEITTPGLLADAVVLALKDAGLSLNDVDGLGVASYTLGPDRTLDLAWQLGLPVRWAMDDIVGLNLLGHAARAIEAGDASTIVLVGGDCMVGDRFRQLSENYNAVTRDYLAPLPSGGPNALYSFLTQAHMARHGLTREYYSTVASAQREWAATNPIAIFRDPLTLDDYRAAPLVADPLNTLDCCRMVAGAIAVVVSGARQPDGGAGIAIRSVRASYNHDNQEGDGLSTGLDRVAEDVWRDWDRGPQDVDVFSVYDNYPVMLLVQLDELGVTSGADWHLHLGRDGASTINTSGGLLNTGQYGAAVGMQGLYECVQQLQGRRGDGQVPDARTAIVAEHRSFIYRHGGSALAAALEVV